LVGWKEGQEEGKRAGRMVVGYERGREREREKECTAMLSRYRMEMMGVKKLIPHSTTFLGAQQI
jgi:hypothetical protein